MSYIAWAVCNMTIIGCFTALAIHFDKWWLVLFSMLFTFSIESQGNRQKKEE